VKAQHLESLVVEVDSRHKSLLLKESELLNILLLLLHLDIKPTHGISWSVSRRSG
jgi:hypothetical protein